MRIAMFTDYFYPELGGIQDSIAVVSRSLAQRGHAVDIYAPRYGEADYRIAGATAREPDLGSNVRVFRRASLPFPSSTRQSRVAFVSPSAWASVARGPRPDVIHSHSFFGVGLDALLTSSLHKIPLIGTNHTTVAGFAEQLPFRVGRAVDYVMWYYNRCDRVTAPSRSVFEDLGLNRLKPPHQVISNPIDTILFAPAAATARQSARARFGFSGPVVAYAGRLAPEKNLDVVLQALALLAQPDGADITLALAGHGSHEASLRALAQSLGIAQRVRFLGTLAKADLAQFFHAADVFVMPSTSETQSMVLLQAMACGLPAIAANSRALPEFVGPAGGLLVDPHDPAGFARSIQSVLGAPAQRAAMGRAGRRLAETYSVENVTGQWEWLYRSISERKRAA